MRSYLLAPVCFIEWKILCSSKTHAVRDQEFIPSAFADNFKNRAAAIVCRRKVSS
jgi:hypothetical protein